MKKNFVMGMLCLAICSTTWAQYTLDSTRRMSPGVFYKHYHTNSPIRQIHVMEIDLNESTINLQAVKSGGVINGPKETVQTMFADHDIFRGHDVTAGINCDFFTSQGPAPLYNPRHMMIGDGEILWDTTLNRTVFGITENRVPFITKLEGAYSVTAGSTNRVINHINRYGGTDQLIMYNRFKGTTTGTAAGGTEVRIVPVNGNGDWKANATISCKVLAKSSSGNMALDSGEAVLYGLGTAKTFLDGINVNDIITLNLKVIADSMGLTNIKQLTGGWTRLIKNGANFADSSVKDEGGASWDLPEPRTAIGHNQTKDKIYFVVVDGREEGVSEGMTLVEMASLMMYLGCFQALNLDGGGSSTMVGNLAELRNDPSDNPPRAIPSALLAYLSSITLDDFENGVGHFNRNPTYSPTTVGVSTFSVVTNAITCHSGFHSLIVKLYDDSTVTTAWKARVLSGSGQIQNNRYFANTGTFSFYLKTSTANTGAKVRLWLDDNDGTELSPQLTINNDGNWHKYTWNLANLNGTTADTGNGQLESAGVRLDAIEFTQPNTATTWFIFVDDIMVDPNGTAGTGVRLVADTAKEIVEVKPATRPAINDHVTVYPNPGNGIFNIDFKQYAVTSFDLQVLDRFGRKLLDKKYTGGSQPINLSHLPAGLYFMYVTSGQINEAFKIVIK
ncbi:MULTISPECIES: phosphodiester glycosidase family protein [Niastella]|uniref:Phosphodiester glycosidase family protein n=1 Tax=Niastella soli TaxID=2821487 RepID=A0ABS3YP43_9BACT|nr:phosphodiester glycosidase family protein [Niastella soli]MBO9199377.1 phosphodiester glycosidase family protein [Niastella soli]